MEHCDPDVLALAALGETVGIDEQHLRGCRRCSDDVKELRMVAELGRSGTPMDDELVQMGQAPPARVWDAIAAATGIAAVPSAASVASSGGTVLPLTTRRTDRRQRDGAAVAAARRWPRWTVAAALVVGLLSGAAGWRAIQPSSPDAAPPTVAAPTTVGLVRLDPLGGATASGQASMLDENGRLVLSVQAAGLPSAQGRYYEVWLLAPDASKMIPLGVLGRDREQLVVPTGVDLRAYPVVDVSIEPYDGDPTHSGDSVLRGIMT